MKYLKYEKYRDSGIEWLGEIPSNWKAKKLKYVADLSVSNVDKKTYDEQRQVRLVNYTDVYYNDFIHSKLEYMVSSASDEEIRKFHVKVGDVIITKDSESADDIGIPAFVVETAPDMVCGYHLSLIRCKPSEMIGGFLFRCFQSSFLSKQFEIIANGVTRYGLPKSGSKSVLLPVPSITEQKSIANFLDKEVSRLDTLIEKKQQFIERLKEKRLAVITNAVTKGIDAKVELKPSGIEWLGDIPSHWDIKKLRYLGTLQNGISQSAEYFGSGHPFISYGDVYNNLVIPKSGSGLANSTFEDQINYSVEEGDIFFTRTSETVEEIGFAATCLNSIEKAVFSGFLIRFRPFKSRLFSGFSKYQFRNQLLRAFFVGEMNIVTRASLGQNILKNLPVLIPPFKEQEVISEFLDREVRKIEKIIKYTGDTIIRLKEYKTSLISAAVTGKIKVTEPS